MQRVTGSRRSVGVLAAIPMGDEKTRAECRQVKRSTKHGEAEAEDECFIQTTIL